MPILEPINPPITKGVHHIGLTVSKLEASATFFIEVLGWAEVRRNDDYPAIFVSDGSIMLTLWAAKTDEPNAFNRKENVGLHHLALAVETLDTLQTIYEKLIEYDITIEFAPEPMRGGPAKHMMCYDPSGIRVELIYVPTYK